jgi:hypothetical protein
MINRRQFLGGTAALFVAPAIIKIDHLMKLYVPPKKIIVRRVDPFGLSPASISLPDARTLQAMKHTLLEAGERYVRPPIVMDPRPAWANQAAAMMTKQVQAEMMKAFNDTMIYGTGAVEVRYG